MSVHLRAAWRSVAASKTAMPTTDVVAQALRRIPASDRAILESFGVKFSDAGATVSFAEYDPETRTIRTDSATGPVSLPVLVHEIGHAIDHHLGWLSMSAPFKAIAKQYVKMSDLTRNLPAAYRSFEWREVWAHGYCALYGGEAPMWWPGNGSDLAEVIRSGRLHRSQVEKALRA